MACDICGATGVQLQTLLHGYATKEIQAICSDCEQVVNRRLWTLRDLTTGINKSLLKRFMTVRASAAGAANRAPTLGDRAIEALAAICGLAGAFLLATKGEHAGLGWLAFLGSNVGWILFAVLRRHWWLLVQQVGFTASSLLGIWRWLL